MHDIVSAGKAHDVDAIAIFLIDRQDFRIVRHVVENDEAFGSRNLHVVGNPPLDEKRIVLGDENDLDKGTDLFDPIATRRAMFLPDWKTIEAHR